MSIQLPTQMQVIQTTGPGGPEVLVTASRPVPVPGPGEVLVKVAAAGVNGPDVMQREGSYPPPPGASDLMGLEVSGTIAALGEGTTNWSIGDEITALCHGGGYAEYVVINARHCLPVPHGLSLVEAASLPETYFTVWSNIFMDARLAAGETFLVHGGAGGIGVAAIQLGKAFGAKVFATAGNDTKCAFCAQMGADRAINYKTEDFVEVLREAGGANVILDIVGGDYIARNFKAAARDGRIAQLAFRQGSKVEIDLMPVMVKRLMYRGSTLRPKTTEQKAAIASELREKVWPLFDKGLLRTTIAHTLPFSQATKAHELMQGEDHRGKILLLPNQ